MASITAKAQEVGLVSPYVYLVGCFYWSFINSLIEECVWRSFLISQCQLLVAPTVAIIGAALFFTIHHSIALYGYTRNWLVVLIGFLGVFVAGVIWGYCYSKYKSIVPGYISHILADIAIAFIAWQLLFVY